MKILMILLTIIITFILTIITSNKIFRSIIYKIFRTDTLKNIFILIVCVLINIDYYILIINYFSEYFNYAIFTTIITSLISFFTIEDK